MGLGSFFSRIFTWWNGQTIGTQIFTWRKGIKVGEDDQGNSYFRDRQDHRRWVIYNGEVEASKIPNEWYSWMHHMNNKIPVSYTHLTLPTKRIV